MLKESIESHADFSPNGDHIGNQGAAGACDLDDVTDVFNLGRDNELLNVTEKAVTSEPWDIESEAQGLALTFEAALTTESEEAAVSEEDQPSVDRESPELIDKSLEPSNDCEGKVYDVENPDEDSSNRFGDEADCEEEDPVENPVDGGN